MTVRIQNGMKLRIENIEYKHCIYLVCKGNSDGKWTRIYCCCERWGFFWGKASSSLGIMWWGEWRWWFALNRRYCRHRLKKEKNDYTSCQFHLPTFDVYIYTQIKYILRSSELIETLCVLGRMSGSDKTASNTHSKISLIFVQGERESWFRISRESGFDCLQHLKRNSWEWVTEGQG